MLTGPFLGMIRAPSGAMSADNGSLVITARPGNSTKERAKLEQR